jgi:hypothetical protein
MRHDPIEFGRQGLATRAAADRVARLTSRLARRARNASAPRAAEVIDEAFAGFSGSTSRLTRVDGPWESTATNDGQTSGETSAVSAWEPMKREIVADLSAQLVALDRQREQLARLLRTIDTCPSGQ